MAIYDPPDIGSGQGIRVFFFFLTLPVYPAQRVLFSRGAWPLRLGQAGRRRFSFSW